LHYVFIACLHSGGHLNECPHCLRYASPPHHSVRQFTGVHSQHATISIAHSHFPVGLQTTNKLRCHICSVHAIKDAFHCLTAENTLHYVTRPNMQLEGLTVHLTAGRFRGLPAVLSIKMLTKLKTDDQPSFPDPPFQITVLYRSIAGPSGRAV
jgi:hypothetical protein